MVDANTAIRPAPALLPALGAMTSLQALVALALFAPGVVAPRAHIEVWQLYNLSREIKTNNFSEQNFNFSASAKNPADWGGYFSGRNAGGRDLIQKRLKGVMILAVNYGDFDRQLRQCTRRLQAAESSPNDYHAWHVVIHRRSFR